MPEEKKQIVSRQHFVPKFYLKKFCNDKNLLEVFSCKDRRRQPPRGPKGLCYEKYFYGLTTGELDDVSQQVEEYFRILEDNIARQYDQAVLNILDNSPVTGESKWVFSFLMSMLWIRGPVMREQVNRMCQDIIKHVTKFKFLQNPKELDEIDEKVGWSEDQEHLRQKCHESIINGDFNVEINNVQHMMMFENIQKYANLFFAKDWLVYISKCEKEFIATDNPVAEIFPQKKSFYGPTFFDRAHYFSVNPSIIIHARCPKERSGKTVHRKSIFDRDSGKIAYLNFIVGSQANYAYASDPTSFDDMMVWIEWFTAQNQQPAGKK